MARGKHRRTKTRPHDSGVTKTGGYSAPPTPSGPLPRVPPGPAPGEIRGQISGTAKTPPPRIGEPADLQP